MVTPKDSVSKRLRLGGLLSAWVLGGAIWGSLLFFGYITVGEILVETLVLLVSLSMALELKLRCFQWKTWLGWLLIAVAMLVDIEDSVWHSPRTALLDRFDVEELLLLSGCLLISTSFMTMVSCLQRISCSDILTGLGNRRAFFTDYAEIKAQAAAHLVYVDLDHFKQVNDTLGHDVGDQLLKRFSDTLVKSLEGNEKGYRLGGDEFIFILYDCCPDERIERIKQSLNAALDTYGSGVSLGVASVSLAVSADELLHLADQKMYDYKRRARER